MHLGSVGHLEHVVGGGVGRAAAPLLRLARMGLVTATAAAPLVAGAALSKPSPPAPHCALPAAAAAMEHIVPHGGIVMSDINLTAPLLYWGPSLRTVAGPYAGPSHGDGAGMVDLTRAATADDPAQLQAILARRHADFLLICGPADDGDGAVRRRLLTGDAPPWLHRVALETGDTADLWLYRVVAQ